MAADLVTHGVLVTFRRPMALRDHLDKLAAQSKRLDTLVVVDNDNDPTVRRIVEEATNAASSVRYLGLENNPGPAGAIAAGITNTVDFVDGDGWLVLLDDDDPPPRTNTLEAVAQATAALTEVDPDVGAVGLWGATLEWTGRLRAARGREPQRVAYLPGGACPHYRLATLRRSLGPDPSLFFGFDDLDLGLAVAKAGGSVWSTGLARDHGWTSMVENRRVKASVSSPTWRRYYSLRNLIVVLRRNERSLAAAVMSVFAGVAKPLANLPFAPRLAARNLRINALALSHGWTGTTGKQLDPTDLPQWLRSP